MVFILISYACCFGQQHTVDGNTLLLCHYNNNINGEQGEIPTISQFTGSSASGIFQNALAVSNNTVLAYDNSNIQSISGTFEAWIRPNWNGNDGQQHRILSWGDAGGMLIEKDGGNYLKVILNLYGTNGLPERSAGTNISNWVYGEWHHIAASWSPSELKLYVDGVLVSQANVGFNPPPIYTTNVHIGSDGNTAQWDGSIDELRISDIVRTEAEITQSHLNGLNITGITFEENNLCMYPTWKYKPIVVATTTNGNFSLNPEALTWTSSNNAVATVNAEGIIQFHSDGTNVSFTACINNVCNQLNAIVKQPAEPEYLTIDPTMSTPADCYKDLMKVVILNYFPTTDGTNLDLTETGPMPFPSPLSLSTISSTVNEFNIQMKHMLEERTKYKGYKDGKAEPFLGYQVIEIVNIFEPMPRFETINEINGTTQRLIDCNAIADRFNFQNYVENLDVDEIWLWGYHTDEVVGWESNMSSPTTGDISNSNRDNDDLPIFDQTYMVYWFNYSRTPNLHNQGHQLESLFGYIDNPFFRNSFVGWQGNNPPLGRCGDTHHPPNTTTDYDYFNYTQVLSDIEDWQPSGGPQKLISAATWEAFDYNWPYGAVPVGEIEVNYYIYWMQNIPGYNNGIPNGADYLNNWWKFVADWDTYHVEGLYGNHPPIKTGNEFPVDEATRLLIHCNNTTDGAQNERAAQEADVNYTNGIIDEALDLGASSLLAYSSSGNISAEEGTFEAWVKPNWDGNDGETHTIMTWGTNGGIVIEKDGGNYLKILINRYGQNGSPEIGASTNIASWQANEWHHVAFTWKFDFVKLYVDGQLMGQTAVGFTPPTVNASTLYIGSDNGNKDWIGGIDELKISAQSLTPDEVQQSYRNGFPSFNYELLLTIVFDSSPEETSWELINEFGNVMAAGDAYDGQTVVNERICLTDRGCYQLILKDQNGICCNGSYTLSDSYDHALVSGGLFTNASHHDFCLPLDACTEPQNAGLDLCTLIAKAGQHHLAYTDCDGDGVQNGQECLSGTNLEDACDYFLGDITLDVIADQSSCPPPTPDLSPIVTVVPANISGASFVGIAVRANELNQQNTDGTNIKVRIPKDQRLTFSWDPSLTLVAFNPVENSKWVYNVTPLFHEFSYGQILGANSNSAFGIYAIYNPQNTSGQTTITATIVPFTGGDINAMNNSDSENLIYFD